MDFSKHILVFWDNWHVTVEVKEVQIESSSYFSKQKNQDWISLKVTQNY